MVRRRLDEKVAAFARAGQLRADAGGALRSLRQRQDEPAASPPPPPVAESEAKPPDILEEVYKPRQAEKKIAALWGWLAFLVLGGVLVGLQFMVQEDQGAVPVYGWVRGIALAIIYLLMLLVAFEDNVWQGVLSLFPPYGLYYGLVRLDSHMLRSLFLALVLALGMELYLIPDIAVATKVQNGINGIIATGESLIRRAGEAPAFD